MSALSNYKRAKKEIIMLRDGDLFMLSASDVESAVMQFICACHPDTAVGYVINVSDAHSCQAVLVHRPQEKVESAATFDAPPTADNVEGNLQTSTNTAMLQLIADIKELFDKVGYVVMTKDSEMYRRIDAVLAQQQHG
jgi:hypothetical protein